MSDQKTIPAPLGGKVVVVTGAASGIGATAVEVLRAQGATVVGWDLAGTPEADPLDLTDSESVQAAAQAVLARHGTVDALVNCAGVITPNLPFESVDPQDFQKCFNVNVMGVVHASQALHQALAASGGAVVNIASQAALVSLPDQSAYSASKGAVAALTRSMAIDWAPTGIRVNAICPGFTLTPMAKQQMTPELDAAVSRRVPLGRMFETEEIGAVIAFLASPAASAVTGVVMPVDGGWTAGEPALPMGGAE
ncbi:SDR family oxidoreductase [Dietzia sp. PP-33]|jgi:meso-butanediol dehydrogenase/(S,S)-butanediol dehydrogenase/diacetyl reductase|uniref:SDR family NAD(P)-dependent oxidoreductase n=1 Tax=Dietzia sp. PP-33 TaxID=2957500 RepID=UPI0029AB7F25|nr:SDR family oxidoreductase [Dietzia sp. PP-33]MDX2357255.1 SDR family oxidoreductase [Dietzia sp. PP-33]